VTVDPLTDRVPDSHVNLLRQGRLVRRDDQRMVYSIA
jgi:hypothetical protein